MLDAEILTAERRRFFVETRGGVYFPIAGVIFWLLLGVAGFRLSERTWCVMVLCLAAAATPVAIVLFRKLVAHLALKSPLATLILPALLPVALSLGMAAAAFYTDLSLVPLALVIGLASHWPAVGWLFGTPIFTVHAIVRVLLAVAIWFLLPDARFTWLPISTAAVYAVTALWILLEVRRVEEGLRPSGQ
jgi:Family of unknown function (DUF7010)